MAVAKTTSRTSSVKTSTKQTASNINNAPNLTNLMLTAELLKASSTSGTKAQIDPQFQSETMSGSVPPSLGTAIKNSPQFLNMVMALICSFCVSAAFYFAGKTMMKTKFNDMFTDKLPRYQNLVYGIGNIKNIDVDRVLLRDDLNDQYFVLDEDTNSIKIDVEKIFEQYSEPLPINQESKDLFVKHSAKNTITQFENDLANSENVVLVQAQQKSSV